LLLVGAEVVAQHQMRLVEVVREDIEQVQVFPLQQEQPIPLL
jgi:hypothetical protein